MPGLLDRDATYDGNRVIFDGFESHGAAIAATRNARMAAELSALIVECVKHWPEPDPADPAWLEWNLARVYVPQYEAASK